MASDEQSKRRSILALLRRIISVKEIRHSWSREDNFSYTELVDLKLEDGAELLKSMQKARLLIESSVTTILSCPSCGKSDYVTILRCVKCGQSALRREYLLEHKAGGHVHPESAFRAGGGFVCPTCGRSLTPSDYRVIDSWFVCENCGERQPLPKLEFRCLVDGTIFTETTSGLRRLSDYRISEKGMAQLKYDKYMLVDDLYSIAKWCGVNVVKEPSYTGASGLKHIFDLTLNCGGEDVKVDVAYSKDAVDEKNVLASYAKIIDTRAQRYVLVAWPKLSREAKTLTAHCKMDAIDASTPEELERAFTSLLDGLKRGGGRCNSSSSSKYNAVTTV